MGHGRFRHQNKPATRERRAPDSEQLDVCVKRRGGSEPGNASGRPDEPASTPLNISSVTVAGDGFSLVTSDYSNRLPCTGTIAPGTGCIVQVQYDPTAVGAQSGTLTISDDGPGSPRNIALNGTGLAR